VSGIGFSELIILALIGLIVLGPERLPRVANQIGGWLGQARRMTRVMKRQLEDELDFENNPTIKPPPASREPSKQPEYTPPRDDDDFSAAHEPDDTGTGVGDIEDTGDSVATAAEPADSPDVVVDEAIDATPDAEPEKQTEKAS
jgi:sec-independent protein translocase protein TatB